MTIILNVDTDSMSGLQPYISHARGFLAEAIVKIILEKYVSDVKNRGHCVVARSEFCGYSYNLIFSELIGLMLDSNQYFLDKLNVSNKCGNKFENVRLWKGILALPIKTINKYNRNNDIKCIDMNEKLIRMIFGEENDDSISLCSNGVSRPRSVINKIISHVESHMRKNDVCFLNSDAYSDLIEELHCLTSCFKKVAGKPCFDFFILIIDNNNNSRGLLIEVKSGKVDVQNMLIRARVKCMSLCNTKYVDVSIVSVRLSLNIDNITLSVHGSDRWLRGQRVTY